MRNLKFLWGMNVFLLLCLAVVIVLWFRMASKDREDGASLDDQKLPTPSASIVARIGERSISQGEIGQFLIQRYGQELLKEVLDHEAIRMEGDKTGVKVSKDEISRELQRMQQGYDSEQQFYDSMRDQLGLTKEEISQDVYYKLLLEKIATRNIKVTDQDVDDYMSSHPEEFESLIQLRLQQIVVPTKDAANKVITAYKGGTDFEELARDRSLDDTTAKNGGDMGWVNLDDPFVPATIMTAAKSLKPGNISAPIATDNGFFTVIRLKERKEIDKATLELTRERVRKELALHQAPPLKELVKNWRAERKTEILDPAYR